MRKLCKHSAHWQSKKGCRLCRSNHNATDYALKRAKKLIERQQLAGDWWKQAKEREN